MDYADKLLQRFGLKIEDLNSVERESYFNMVDAAKTGTLSIDTLREKIELMRDSLVLELGNYNLDPKQDLFLKARLKNYTLIIGILTSPIKAQKALEHALGNVKPKS